MEKTRDDVELDEFNSLDQIEKELLYKIHMKSVNIGKGVSFEYVLAMFKPKYSFDEIIKGLNGLRAKGYLRCKSFYESTFEWLEYSDDMEEVW